MQVFNKAKQCVFHLLNAFDRNRLRLIPSLAFAIIAGIFAIIWVHLQQREMETLQEKTEMAADQVVIRLQKYLGMRMHMVGSMRDAWTEQSLSTPEAFQLAASFLERNLGGIQAINFIDPSGVIRWVVPEESNPGIKGKSLLNHPQAGAVFRRAVETGHWQMTSVIDLMQGGKGIVGYLPVTIRGKREGYINVVINVQPMIEEVVAGSIHRQFYIEILDDNEVLYSYGEGKRLRHTYLSAEIPFNMGPVNWTIRLFPNRRMFMENTTLLDDFMLASGFVLALWLALLLRRLLLREVQLKDSEERYRAIFRNAQVGLFRIRLGDGKVLQANPVMAKIFGYDNAKEFVRDYYMAPNWVEPKRREELHRQFADHGGTADNFEAQFFDKNGEKIWVRFSARVFPERGYMEGVGLGINEEKAQRQALEESEKRFRALAESTSAVIFIMDENNRIRYANKAAVEGTGYSQEELANLDPGSMMTPESQAKMFELEHNADPSDRNFGPFELEIQCKGGEKAWIAMTIGIFEAEGERAYISTSFDITERKKTEEALKQSEAKFRAIFENAQAGLFRLDLNSGRVLETNGKMAAMFGYDDAETFMEQYRLQSAWMDQGERERLLDEFEKGNQTVDAFETRFLRRDGRVFWMRFSASLEKQQGYMEGVGIDITREKETAQHLKDSELRFRALADSTSAAIHITSMTDLIYCNQALEILSGYDLEELRTLPDSKLIAPESLPVMETLARAIMTGKPLPREPLEFCILTRDGERRWLQSSIGIFQVGGEDQFIWTSFEITARKKAEEALRHSEELFRTIYENAPVMIAAFDSAGKLFLWNRHLEDVFGYGMDEVQTTNDVLALCYPDSLELLRLVRDAETHDGKFHEVHPTNRRGEHLTQLWAHFSLPDGTVVSVGHDITDRTKAEEALRDSESKYRTIFETTGTGTVIFGDDGIISLANAEFCHLVGRSREDLEGYRKFWELFDEASRQTILEHHHKRSQEPELTPRAYEVNLVDVHARVHEGVVSIGLVPGTTQRVASFLDLTERKQAERQIVQADKMAALGQIIAGVAHEINNPNNFIYFNLPILRQYLDEIRLVVDEKLERDKDLLLMGLPADDFLKDVYQLLEDMEHGSSRITGIVSELKNYVRSHEEEKRKPVRVESLFRQVMTLVGKQVRKMVKRLDVELAEDLPPVLMLAGKLEQVLINLLINAGQAADKEDSLIRLTARKAEKDGEPAVELTVEDNGQGIPAAIIDRIFEPFFTTKSRESGTGLGLAISNRIVEEHGGTLFVESRPGEGTRFTILLPASSEALPEKMPTGEYPIGSDETESVQPDSVEATDRNEPRQTNIAVENQDGGDSTDEDPSKETSA